MSNSETAAWDELALDYHGQVITPFAEPVDFRLARDLDRLLRGWRKDGSLSARTVIDIGVGCGESTELIASRPGLTIAIDFSPGMLTKTSERLRRAGIEHQMASDLSELPAVGPKPRTMLVTADMRSLGPLHGRADLVLAINSITGASPLDTDAMFANAVACTRAGGDFIAVFPSLDSFEYLVSLGRKHGVALDVGEVDADGYYQDPGGSRQKFFGPDELRTSFEHAGLQLVEMTRVEYPWSVIAAAGWGHFPRHRRLWDWFLWAKAT